MTHPRPGTPANGERIPGVLDLDGHLLIGGGALIRLAALAKYGLGALERNGQRQPPSSHALVDQLYAKAQRLRAQLEADDPPVVPVADRDGSEVISVADAARMLSLSDRQVRRMAAQLGARRLSHATNAPMVLDRSLVEAEAFRRRAR